MSLGGTSTFTDLDPGTYTVSTTIFGYDCQSVSANVQADQTIAAQLSGASRLTYKGTPRFTKQDTSGSSTIQSA